MKIILTNDDGFDALGLATIKEILQQYGEVFTFAPLTPQSGKSSGFTTYRKPIQVYRQDSHNFQVDGTPVDCVLFANAYFHGDYDMVVSGCNNGYNMSNDMMYSGTCGACFQGLVFKKKCMAISAPTFTDNTHIKNQIPEVLQYIFANDLLSGEYYLNVSINRADVEYKGVLVTKLHERYQSNYTLTALDEPNTYVVKHIHDDDILDDNQWDVSAVYNGYASITPIGLTPFKEQNYIELVNKLNKTRG